ncbi:MAG: beta-lactamase [Herbinix sp.]|jgi:CubicO group peptidase (beta-lactamase class C family)|nr:beta-lactamase [Herbinix sp.]
MMDTQRFKQVEQSISELLDHEILKDELAGAAVCITYKKEEVFRKNYGYADLESKRVIENNTIFRLYSMTKPITAVASMILLERGKIDLHTPISEYLKAFKNMKVLNNGKPVDANREILVRDLLSMTSGLVYPDPDPAGFYMQKLFDHLQNEINHGNQIPTKELCDLIAEQPLAFHPGDRWRYGLSSDVMGAIIEVVSGKSLGEFYQSEIFDPLAMVDTGFYVPKEKQNRLAQLYRYIEKEDKHSLEPEENRHLCLTKCLEPPLFESGGAGLLSTMDDYIKFTNMLVNGGRYQDKQILGKKAMEVLTCNQLTEKQRATVYFETLEGYGYGNFMRVNLDPSHSGGSGCVGEFGWDGWTGPYFTVNPTDEFTFIFMVQRCEYSNPALIRKLRNIAYSFL